MPRNSKDLSPLGQSVFGSDQTARLRSRFNHDNGATEARDNAIACREMTGLGLQAVWLFGQAQTFGPDGMEQFGVFVGIDNINAAAQYGNCPYLNRGMMRGGIHTAGEA